MNKTITVPTLLITIPFLAVVLGLWGWASWRFLSWFVDRWIARYYEKHYERRHEGGRTHD